MVLLNYVIWDYIIPVLQGKNRVARSCELLMRLMSFSQVHSEKAHNAITRNTNVFRMLYMTLSYYVCICMPVIINDIFIYVPP